MTKETKDKLLELGFTTPEMNIFGSDAVIIVSNLNEQEKE